MEPTSISLLDLLKQENNQNAWRQMLDIYQPLIGKWLGRLGAPENEVHDLSQSILVVVVRKLPQFQHQGNQGAFRSWLKNITRNCLLEYWRSQKLQPIATGKTSFQESLNQLADDSSELSQLWNQEYDRQVLASLLQQIQNEFQPSTWEAFRLVTIDGVPAKSVAEQLDMTVNSVFIAKSRVMSRLRVVGKYMID